jgi:hypothetical protein
MESAFGFAEFLIGTAVALFVICLGFFGYAASRSPDNPLRQVAGALAARLGVTVGISLIDIPLAFFEPFGGVIDAGSILFLVVYWTGFFITVARAYAPPARAPVPAQQPQIVYMPQPQPDRSVTLLSAD